MSVNTHSNKQELLTRLSRAVDSSTHKDLLALIRLQLEKTKDKLVNCPLPELPSLQGQAQSLHELMTDLQRPPLKAMLEKEQK